MTIIDWLIVGLIMAGIMTVAYKSLIYNRSVADFLAANRCGGRYLMSVAEGIAGLGAITIIANFEIYYKAGFTFVWWSYLMMPAIVLIIASGFIVYRFRKTGALTLGQFLEQRYSRNFRVFSGIICFLSGIVNFGLFPGVSAKFFVRFCGFPEMLNIFGFAIPTFAICMLVLLAISLLLTFSGGQITIMIGDFLQGVLCNFVFIAIIIVLVMKINFSQITETIALQPQGQSLINPFDSQKIQNFNIWYIIITIVGLAYNWMGWQGAQAFNSSAKHAHEARMAKVLGNWRSISQQLFFIFIPICAYTVMNNADFSSTAALVNGTLDKIGVAEDRFQMISPAVLRHMLPVGLMGAFAGVIILAFISTHNSCLHSWGSIFVQDVVLPLRKKPLTPSQHMLCLRLSICFVAVFVFCFSLFYSQTQHIVLFWAVTGAIFLGGSGAVIIGGFYWKRGTTAAAYSAMIVGGTIAVTGFVANQIFEDFLIDGQWSYFLAMICGSMTYVLVSLLGKRSIFDIQSLFGDQHNLETKASSEGYGLPISRISKILGITSEFTFFDKLIYFSIILWGVGWFAIFAFGVVWQMVYGINPSFWPTFWYIWLVTMFVVGVVTVVWFSIGGFIDIKSLFDNLKILKRDSADNGTVSDSTKINGDAQ